LKIKQEEEEKIGFQEVNQQENVVSGERYQGYEE
jgi:hypothetical protein